MINAPNNQQVQEFIQQTKVPPPNSRKGENGKLLIVGGSNLFHAASRWSLDIASKLVDMVFYSSVPSNNRLIQKAKQEFWNGIVIPRDEVENYIQEADCILIGPGMERQPIDSGFHQKDSSFYRQNPPNNEEWNNNTQKVVNYLLAKHPQKRWVIDAGALQMMSPSLLSDTCIITPHQKEMEILLENAGLDNYAAIKKNKSVGDISKLLSGSTILLKGVVDQVGHQGKTYEVGGGNAGLTKGGTGDVLAGLLAGLYAVNPALVSAVTASCVNKLAGERLHKNVGPYYNATDLVEAIPKVLWELIKEE